MTSIATASTSVREPVTVGVEALEPLTTSVTLLEPLEVTTDIHEPLTVGTSEYEPVTINQPATDLDSVMRVSILDYGAVPTDIDDDASDGADCTDALLSHIEWMHSRGTKASLYFPPGKRYHFRTADILSGLSSRDYTSGFTANQIWDMTSWLVLEGAFPQNEVQGREQVDIKHAAEIAIHTANDSDVWLRKYRRSSTVEFGNWVIRNLTFTHHSTSEATVFGRGKFLELGDPDPSPQYVTGDARGVTISGCYFTSPHFATTYIADAGADGYVYQTTYQAPLVHLTNIYDLTLRDCTVRGGPAEGVWLQQCDAPRVDNLHTILNVRGLRMNGLPGQSNPGVPGRVTATYNESCIHVGLSSCTSACDVPCVEMGYDNEFEPDTDPRPMIASITWTIAASNDATPANRGKIAFDNFPVGRTLADYLMPGGTIEVTPDTSGQPTRAFVIDYIDGNDAYFAEHLNGCFVPVALSGTGDNVTRRHAQNLVGYGNRFSASIARLEKNQQNSNQPNWSLCPGTIPMRVTFGAMSTDNLITQKGEIIRHVAGDASGLGGFVLCDPWERPEHPYARIGIHEIDRSVSAQTLGSRYDRRNGVYIAEPGRGETTQNSNARELFFRLSTAIDPLAGRKVFAWHLDDVVSHGGMFIPLHPSIAITGASEYRDLAFIIRVYHPTGSDSIRIWDGNANIDISVNANWQNISGTLGSSADRFQINALDVGGDGGIEVEFVESTLA